MYYATFYRDWSDDEDLTNIRPILTMDGLLVIKTPPTGKLRLQEVIDDCREYAYRINAERIKRLGAREAYGGRILGFTLHAGDEMEHSSRLPGTRLIAVKPYMQRLLNYAYHNGHVYLEDEEVSYVD